MCYGEASHLMPSLRNNGELEAGITWAGIWGFRLA